jgi:cytochrome c peroxidase
MTIFSALSPKPFPRVPADLSNRWADDPDAALLGQRLFFDTRFSGPLLASEHDGSVFGSGLGLQGTPGKVACSSCHMPSAVFSDTRSTKQQVSLGAGWTHRRSPSLIDVGYSSVLMWDGRRDAGFNQVFGAIEASAEMNSSRLFVAQQMERLYKAEYEHVFKETFADLSDFPMVAPQDAGCKIEQATPTTSCPKPYDDRVNRVVANFGKAMNAYLRRLTCGPGRFDAWVNGDASAINAQERRGAELFVGKGRCVSCHSGPHFTDQKFHNIGLPFAVVSLVIRVGDDPGAAQGIPAMLADPLNVRGKFSDGYDGRLDALDRVKANDLLGAFRTPSLRCVEKRPSFTHTGQLRTLGDVVAFFNQGGARSVTTGTKEIGPLNLTLDEQADLVAFLRTLTGPGPAADLLAPPPSP